MRTSRSTAARRKLGAAATVFGLAAVALAGTDGVTAPPAEALTPPVGMTADALPTWQTNGIVWAMAQANGVVFVGGTFSTVRPPGAAPGTQETPVDNFVALDAATGAPISGCDLGFTLSGGGATVRAMTVSPDKSTLYVGGYFGAVNGVGASSIAAFDTATCARKSFPVAVNATVRALAATDTALYMGGDFTSVAGQTRERFAAVNTSGTLLGWTADADEPGRGLDVTPDGGHVVLGGDFFTINGQNTHALAVVDATTGANVRNYPDGYFPTRSVVKSVYIDETGIYTASEGTGGGVFDGRTAHDLGTWDQRWRDTCLGATQDVTVYEGVVYSGHHAHDCSSMGYFPDGPRFHLFGQSVTTGELHGWYPDTNDGLGEQIGPRVLEPVTDHPSGTDYLWVGGEFTSVNGSTQWGLTRFAAGDAQDTGAPERPEVQATSLTPGEVTVNWRSSLDLDDDLLTYRVYRDGTSGPVHTVQGYSVPWKRPQLSFTDTSVTAGQSYTYRVTATDAAGNVSAQSLPATVTAATSAEPYADAVLADNPELYWRYDETQGFYASDSSGNNHSGVHRGNPSRGITPPAVDGPGARGIGYTGGITTYTYSDQSFPAPSQWSGETWFKTTTTEGGKLFGFGREIWRTSRSYDKHLYMRNDGRLTAGVYAGGTRTITSPAAYNDGQWHHVVVTQGGSGQGLRMYVDGTLVASNSLYTSNQNFLGYWRTGADNLSNWPTRPSSDGFQGQMDETAIYHHTLSAARVAAHYAAASAPADTVTEVRPTADTYVNEGAPSSNYGSSTSLASRGSLAYQSYLQFDLPEAPAGTVLKAAALRIRTNTQSYAGSADDHMVVPITGAWTEGGTTYSTRPTLDTGTVLGTLTGATSPDTVYSASLDASGLSGSLGGTVDLAVISEGTDNVWFWSSEVSSEASRPTLLLTFGAP
ncbi:LamG-like jellyroll fold domain-containing protein [Streptomyces sp. YIM 98790]|uniref:LamG-like jellyroll fold domain-containing protein n=1 Tax=Streptomyces sp. YIM 98790 TaxID=2689077 RepID=UPI001409215E|nr:LamG-like jellyroll fold domain-containing protein [Streptomyces sp. YIM 98790]